MYIRSWIPYFLWPSRSISHQTVMDLIAHENRRPNIEKKTRFSFF